MDFINSDKQAAMKWYEEATSHAAEYKLLVSFHGAITPRGLRRTYPNIMTYEGVRGAEYYKWPGNDPTPEHNCTLPYTRNVGGPMDYTPASFSTPGRTTTYAHEMALPFVFESGWICMADKPEEFRRSPAKDLFQNLHAAWDDIHFIDGYPGEYCCLARRKGDEWFVAAINAAADRQIEIPFDFLTGQNYSAKLYTDDGKDGLMIKEMNISNKSIEGFDLVKNGGFVIHLVKRG
jgi:alpha-glucosidase